MTNDKSTQTAVAITLAILTLGYLLPWAIAASGGKANSGGIGMLNLLAGWTVIGWVIAFAMAISADRVIVVEQHRA